MTQTTPTMRRPGARSGPAVGTDTAPTPQREQEQTYSPYGTYTAKDGRVISLTKFHLLKSAPDGIGICPVCNARPCTWDCPEQHFRDSSGDRANTKEAQEEARQMMARRQEQSA